MSKKKARKRKAVTHTKNHGHKRRKVVTILGVILFLSFAGGILARWESARVASKSAPTSLMAVAPVPTPSPLSLSKEYIYAGGKLVAIEESAGSNAAPSVQLTAPSSGFTTTAPANITLTATASDNGGSIAKVEFFQGAIKLGEDISTPYSFSWSNVTAGSYSLTAKATDNLGLSTTSAAVNITVNTSSGSTTENVAWANAVNVQATGNSLTRSATTSAWDGGASSTKAIASGNGYVEFIAGSSGGFRMCGLSSSLNNGDASQHYNDIDYAIYLLANGTVGIYEKGISRGVFGSYSPTDHFKVSVNGGAVTYWRGNTQLAVQNSPPPTYPLGVDTSLYTPNSSIENVIINGSLTRVAAGTENVTWTNLINVQATGSTLRRTATTSAWDGGAASVQQIVSGDGYVEFIAGDGGFRMCGLSSGPSNDDTNQHYNDIDYAIYLMANGSVNVYEKGVWRKAFGTYTTGQKFRVAVENGAVKYYQGVTQLVVEDTPAPIYPLRVDTSLYTPNTSITNVVISGWLTP